MGKPGTWLGLLLKSWGDDWFLQDVDSLLLVLLESPSSASSGKVYLCLLWNPLLWLHCGVIHGVHFGWAFVFLVQAGELGEVHRRDTSSVHNSPAFCNMQCTSVSNNSHGCGLGDCRCEGFPPPLHSRFTQHQRCGCLTGGLDRADYLVI